MDVDVLVLETRDEVVDVVLAIVDDDDESDVGKSGKGRFIERSAMMKGSKWWERVSRGMEQRE